jgi:fumarate hydratase subunit alpha
MREIHVDQIAAAVSAMCQEAGIDIGEDMFEALEQALRTEESPLGKHVLQILLENARMAKDEGLPYCQDCGVAVFFVELGQEVHIQGGGLTEAINEGVRRGYQEGYLRKSMVRGPFDRVNTGDNTPAMIHYNVLPGDSLKIAVTEKGGGCENMSRQAMLRPADGIEGVKRFVVETVAKAGPNACPPLIPGVGIGGGFDVSTELAKKSLFRRIGDFNPDPTVAQLEKELILLCNETGVGPQGLGGRNTVLWVPVEVAACHLTGLPVGVNIQCHAQRHREVTL